MQCWVDDVRHGLHEHDTAGVGAVEVRERTEVEPARRLRELRRQAVRARLVAYTCSPYAGSP
jgi:hypothetical protein